MGNGALRPKAEDSLRAIAKLPEDGADLVGSSVKELIARIVRMRGLVRANMLQYDKQIEMVIHSKDEEKKAAKESHDSVLLPPALSNFCTIKDSREMKPLYSNVVTAQSDFEASDGTDDTALCKAVSELLEKLPECIQTRARAPGSLPEFAHVVDTGNEFFEGVYTQVRLGMGGGEGGT